MAMATLQSPSPSVTSNNGLWDDIDLAERYLISSQFEEAVAICSTVLKRLKDMLESYPDKDEVSEMIESAAMVLIQAYSESGRSNILFNDLEIIFGYLAKVPSSIFLSGVCLQISGGCYLDAQSSIESFLLHWALKGMDEDSCICKLNERIYFSLKPETYLEIIDLYCVEVLTRGLNNVEAALHWLNEVDIPDEKKQDMLVKLKGASETTISISSNEVLFSHQRMAGVPTKTSKDFDSEIVTMVSESNPTMGENRRKKQTFQENGWRSLLSRLQIFPIMDVFSGWMPSSCSDASQYASRMDKDLGIVSRRKRTFSGAALILLLFAFYKQRKHLSRVAGRCGKAVRNFAFLIYTGLFDFWQLAFNVQLNPLANVHPSPQIRA